MSHDLTPEPKPRDDESSLAIRTKGMTRRFAAGHGVFDLDLEVPSSGIYGFLGPNGAGKTTTIRLILGLLRPDAGEIEIFDESSACAPRSPLRHVGALVETPSLYPHLSGAGNLRITATLLGIGSARCGAVLEQVGLAEDGHRRVSEYSLGMRQRLGLALALLPAPRLLILDEPTNGLDPAGILDMRRMLRDLSAQGVAVLVSSHQLTEIDLLADHVGVLAEGRMCFQGPMDQLRDRARPRLRVHCDTPAEAARVIQALGLAHSPAPPDAIDIDAAQGTDGDINRHLVEAGIRVHRLARPAPSLESLFFDLTLQESAA